MKALIGLVVMVGVAHADATVEKLVRTALLDHSKIDAGAIVEGSYVDAKGARELNDGLHTYAKISNLVVHVDDSRHVAWFRADAGRFHISGVAANEMGWKIAAVFESYTYKDGVVGSEGEAHAAPDLPPRTLKRGQPSDPMAGVNTSGDSAIYQPVADWLMKGSLADGADPDAVFQTNMVAGGRALAKQWDERHMGLAAIRGRKLLGDDFGLVEGYMTHYGVRYPFVVVTMIDNGKATWVIADFR